MNWQCLEATNCTHIIALRMDNDLADLAWSGVGVKSPTVGPTPRHRFQLRLGLKTMGICGVGWDLNR